MPVYAINTSINTRKYYVFSMQSIKRSFKRLNLGHNFQQANNRKHLAVQKDIDIYKHSITQLVIDLTTRTACYTPQTAVQFMDQ